MKKVSILFIGAGGYAAYILGLLRDQVDGESYELVGVADPYADKSPIYGWLKEKNVPLYDTPEAFYAEHKADLAVIASPIHLHKQQCLAALRNGSHVLCEKPITACIQDAREMEEAAKRCNRLLAVGFQWCFYPPMVKAKRDILAGRFGKPVLLKSFVAWQRYDSYYDNGWKGRIRSKDGSWLLDSVATNATAHHLHNMFFLLGEEMASSLFPSRVRGAIYRAKDIESFDTATLDGEFPGGGRFLYLVSHSTDENRDPRLEYRFEKGVMRADLSSGSTDLIAEFDDGTRENYGSLESDAFTAQKLVEMIAAVRDGAPLNCVPRTVYPHLTVCNAMLDTLDIVNFPSALCRRMQNGQGDTGTFVSGLYAQLLECFEKGLLPSGLGLPWAVPETEIPLAGYSAFTGKKFS